MKTLAVWVGVLIALVAIDIKVTLDGFDGAKARHKITREAQVHIQGDLSEIKERLKGGCNVQR